MAEIMKDHTIEEPVDHTTRDALNAVVAEIDDIEWTDAPTVIVTILPVLHAVLPPASTIVTTPPLASNITVLQSPVCHAQCIGLATEVVDVLGSHT